MTTIINVFIQVFGILAAITTICLGFPQLLHLRKTKKTGNVNYLSFWIFYFGLLVWLVLGVFGGNEDGWYIFVANFICTIIYSFTMFYLHYYDQNRKEKTLSKVVIAITFFVLFTIAMFAVFSVLVYHKIKFNKFYPEKGALIKWMTGTESLIFGLIAPSFTTLAFMPQLIISFKNKDFKGLTPWMPSIFLVNNTWWIIFFSLSIVNAKNQGLGLQDGAMTAFIGGLIWQIISTIVYAIQLAFILHYKELEHKHAHEIKMQQKSA
ncbi:SemiSWEET family transporter [Mycoplasma struthionis]|uniref:PQ-loop repeat-containing protein n=1 Tax=Mycoplasma struthionis TaxID=538220 RepID=A0A502M773_9MOLU|nr:SemiSWEET family transporter [Mycoplasma struthionis]TPI01328.1 hypothetical protein FJM01_02745 [Mycoplasma struthionis]